MTEYRRAAGIVTSTMEGGPSGSANSPKVGILSRDTDAGAERHQVTALRRALIGDRARMVRQMIRACHQLMWAGLRLRRPGLTDAELGAEASGLWLQVARQDPIRPLLGKGSVGVDLEPFAITAQVVAVLDTLGVEYVLGGSLASSIHGEPRATRDADLVAKLNLAQCPALASGLGEEFYVSLPAMEQAVRQRSSFNVVHLGSGFKVDLFLSKGRPFERSRFARKREVELEGHRFYVSTPEDILLAKLEWYRLGNEVSDQQWRDILALLVIQAEALDLEYARSFSAELGVEDLLRRALGEVGR